MILYRFAGTNKGLLFSSVDSKSISFPTGNPVLTPVALNSRLAVTGHSIPDAMFKYPWDAVIEDAGFTPDIVSGTGPFASADFRWINDPAGPDQTRAALEADGASFDLFLGIEAHGGNYGSSPSRTSVLTHVQNGGLEAALNWHNLAASTGAQTFYANFWRNDTEELWSTSWRNAHSTLVNPGDPTPPYDSLTELEFWDWIIDYVNENKDIGTPDIRLVPWLQVYLAIYDAIEADEITGVTMSDFFYDDVHPTDIGTWVLMATVMAVMYHRHPDQLSHSVDEGAFDIDSGLAAQLRPIIWETCLSTPRTGMYDGIASNAMVFDGNPLLFDGNQLIFGT